MQSVNVRNFLAVAARLVRVSNMGIQVQRRNDSFLARRDSFRTYLDSHQQPLLRRRRVNCRVKRKCPEETSGEISSSFPWIDSFEIEKDLHVTAAKVMECLGPLMMEERKDRILEVCRNRTFNVLPILEHPYDWGNVAAVCRSADALGCGAVHIIRKSCDEKYKQSARTSAGADKWLDIQLYDNTEDCLLQAKRKGFQIVATCLDDTAVTPDKIDWGKKTAIVFGSELEGITETVLDMADATCYIPIDGFVESYNISVAASLLLWEARRQRIEIFGRHGDLTEEEIEILQGVFYLRNKGVFKNYAASLLKRPPPSWQTHRDWKSKDFNMAPSRKFSMSEKEA